MTRVTQPADHKRAWFDRDWRIACAAGATTLLAAAPSGALEWSYVPAVTVGAAQDSNIHLQPQDGLPVGNAALLAGADVVGRNEGLDLQFAPRVNSVRYDDDSVMDRNDIFANLNLATHNERRRWSFGGSYVQESTLNSAFEASGAPAVDLDRKQTSVSTSWDRSLERGRYTLSAATTGVDYQESPFSPYRDYRYDVLQGAYTRVTSERSSWRFSVEKTQVSTEGYRVRTLSTDVRATWIHAFSESLQAQIGVGVLDATTEGAVRVEKSAPALNFSLNQSWPRWRFSVNAGRSLEPDGYGSLLREDSAQVGMTRLVTERFNVGATSLRARVVSVAGLLDRDYSQDTVTLQWRLRRRWILEGAFFERRQQWTGLPEANGFVSQLSITYRGG